MYGVDVIGGVNDGEGSSTDSFRWKITVVDDSCVDVGESPMDVQVLSAGTGAGDSSPQESDETLVDAWDSTMDVQVQSTGGVAGSLPEEIEVQVRSM